ncbi:MAG TPA: hypothetical protein VHD34_07475 [Xanthobacteraceae bacterium]|nr:hypothetical protein [Xanthobacteraceae bacterium]
MNRLLIVRLAAIIVGAAVLYGLQQGLGMAIYLALPLAFLAYLGTKLGLGLAWDVDARS